MSAAIDALTMTVSITQFNRGHAGQIFEDVRKNGTKVVMKNNAPEVVLVSPEEYIRDQKELEDLRLLVMAQERLARYDPSTLISQDEVDRRFNITEEDLKGYEEVEFE